MEDEIIGIYPFLGINITWATVAHGNKTCGMRFSDPCNKGGKPRGKVEHPRFLDRAGAQAVIGALGKWIVKRSPKITQKGN